MRSHDLIHSIAQLSRVIIPWKGRKKKVICIIRRKLSRDFLFSCKFPRRGSKKCTSSPEKREKNKKRKFLRRSNGKQQYAPLSQSSRGVGVGSTSVGIPVDETRCGGGTATAMELEKRSRDRALSICRIYTRETPRYSLLKHLNNVGLYIAPDSPTPQVHSYFSLPPFFSFCKTRKRIGSSDKTRTGWTSCPAQTHFSPFYLRSSELYWIFIPYLTSFNLLKKKINKYFLPKF